MARLTEREMTMIQRAQETSWERAAEAAPQILEAARKARAAVFGATMGRGFKKLVRYTGLSDLAHFVNVGLVTPLRRGACYRRTLHELRHLDSHRLHDIGMTREELERFAWQAAIEQVPANTGRPWLFTRVQAYIRRRALVRQLVTLDDRALQDIGVERGDIGQLVDQMLVREYPELQTDKQAAATVPVKLPSRSDDLLRELATRPSPVDLFILAQARRAA